MKITIKKPRQLKHHLLSFLLLLLFLPSIGFAQSPAQQLNAPKQVTLKTFQTDSGKSIFRIDAEIEIPNVDRLNTYEYRVLPVTETMLSHVAEALGYPDITFPAFTAEPHTSVSYPITFSEYSTKSMSLYGINSLYDDLHCSSGLGYKDQALAQEEDCSAIRLMRLWPCYDVAAPDTTYPFADATTLALDAVKQIAPEMTLAQSGIVVSYTHISDAEIKKLNDPNYQGEKPDLRRYGAYGYLFERVIDGVSVTMDESHDGCGYDPNDLNSVSYERLALVVKDGQIVSLLYDSPSAIGEPIQTDVQLIPFQQILGISQTILPQKYKEAEIHMKDGETVTYVIDRIMLGYMRVRQSANPKEFELVPVWDFFGETLYNPNPNSYERPGTLFRDCILTINAMDGTVIDRDFGY